jgi:hypothetical protein
MEPVYLPPSPPEEATDSPRELITRIAANIRGKRFFKDELKQWSKRGFLFGAGVGLFLGVVCASLFVVRTIVFQTPSSLTGYQLIYTAVMILLGIPFYLSVMGWLAGAVGGYLWLILKPIYAAIFWDVERYEREYGAGLPTRRRSK